MTQFQFNLQPKAAIGDLIAVKGYGNRLFRVEEVLFERRFTKDETFDDILYDVHCVDTDEYVVTWDDDTTLIARASGAEIHLRNRPADQRYDPDAKPKPISEWTVQISMSPKPKAKAPKPLTNAQQIDKLLDKRNDLRAITEVIGDSDGNYAGRIADIDTKIKRLGR